MKATGIYEHIGNFYSLVDKEDVRPGDLCEECYNELATRLCRDEKVLIEVLSEAKFV